MIASNLSRDLPKLLEPLSRNKKRLRGKRLIVKGRGLVGPSGGGSLLRHFFLLVALGLFLLNVWSTGPRGVGAIVLLLFACVFCCWSACVFLLLVACVFFCDRLCLFV